MTPRFAESYPNSNPAPDVGLLKDRNCVCPDVCTILPAAVVTPTILTLSKFV